MSNVRAHLFIYGDVVGVGFRAWMVGKARNLGLTGWVKNAGREVEAIIEGAKDKVEEMIKLSRNGPPVAMVERVDVQWEGYKGEWQTFEIDD